METAPVTRQTAWRWRSAVSSWGSPVQYAAATKSSAPAHAVFASNAAPARDVAEAARCQLDAKSAHHPIRLDNRTELRLIGHARAHGYSARARRVRLKSE